MCTVVNNITRLIIVVIGTIHSPGTDLRTSRVPPTPGQCTLPTGGVRLVILVGCIHYYVSHVSIN